MCIFYNIIANENPIQYIIANRKLQRIHPITKLLEFASGDILVIIFWAKGILYRFEGLCICLRKKNFRDPDVSLILRNVLVGVGIEFSISYFYNRIFFLKINDYKRKRFLYRKAKLYYLRLKLNHESRIKG